LFQWAIRGSGASFSLSKSNFTPKDLNPMLSAASLSLSRLLPTRVVSNESPVM
tara:strand:+ start:177 stop:335 length:159 start_codon:yes stop_codon:yes gene_type:complete